MIELISGKEAFNAAMDGKEVLWRQTGYSDWLEWTKDTAWCINSLEHSEYQFKLKPKTILLNDIEVPAPFEPKDADHVFILANFIQQGYMECKYPTFEDHVFQFGTWRTEEEIKEVVAALRSIFKGE